MKVALNIKTLSLTPVAFVYQIKFSTHRYKVHNISDIDFESALFDIDQ